jgi:hypothetical protein
MRRKVNRSQSAQYQGTAEITVMAVDLPTVSGEDAMQHPAGAALTSALKLVDNSGDRPDRGGAPRCSFCGATFGTTLTVALGRRNRRLARPLALV